LKTQNADLMKRNRVQGSVFTLTLVPGIRTERGKSVTAKEYLEQIRRNECIIRNKQIERKYWMELASGITAGMGGDRVQSTKNTHPMESKVVEAAMIDQEIDRLKAEIADIISTIQRLPTEEYDFLHKVYVQHLSLKEVQAISEKSYSWVTTTHSRALYSLQYILDHREKAGA